MRNSTSGEIGGVSMGFFQGLDPILDFHKRQHHRCVGDALEGRSLEIQLMKSVVLTCIWTCNFDLYFHH